MGAEPNDLISNPQRERLMEALARVRAHAARLETALDPAHAMFTQRDVWVGPVARNFAAELTARRQRLRMLVGLIIEDLEAEIRSTPEKVPRASVSWS